MATTIITTDKMTAVRAAAISQITGNDTIGVSKALLIEEAKRQMLNGICHFIFRRKDGSLTKRYGTLIPSLCSKHVKGTGTSPEQRGCMIFWDCSIGAFRSCRWENIVTIL